MVALAVSLALWSKGSIEKLMCGGMVLYALWCKGNVNAEYSHGNTTFKLEAKERGPYAK